MKNEMWLIWKEPISRRRYIIGTLTNTENRYTFVYTDPELSNAQEKDFKYFPGFEDIKKIYESENLFANIKTRLPNIGRPDYLEILNCYNLEKDSTEMEILKATKGRLLTDNYEFVPVFDKRKIEFEVAGTRHCSDLEDCKKMLEVNERLYLELEPENEFDENAIKVNFKNEGVIYHLGYVPRYYSKELAELLAGESSYSAMIQSLNFDSENSDENITATVKMIFN
ncbi:MAG: HIRAN domain-containing protein [Bacilli bacterium]|nr:HIRAN domain-containing protein [Bacilli bacterium]